MTLLLTRLVAFAESDAACYDVDHDEDEAASEKVSLDV